MPTQCYIQRDRNVQRYYCEKSKSTNFPHFRAEGE